MGATANTLCISVILFVTVSLFVTWNSQPATIVWMDTDVNYHFTENSNSTINIHIKVYQDNKDELVILVTYIDEPPVNPIIQINRTSPGPREQVALLEIDSDNFSFVLTNIFPVNTPHSSTTMSVGFNINIEYWQGHYVYPIIIDNYEQQLDITDLALFSTKFAFPLLLLSIPFFPIENPARNDEDDVQVFKEFSVLFILGVILSLFIPFLFYFLFVLTTLYSARILLAKDPTNNHSVFNAVVTVLFVINATPLSLGEGYIAEKIRFLELDFPYYPLLPLLLIIFLGSVVYINTREEESYSTTIPPVLWVYVLVMLVATMLFSRLIL